MLRWYEQRGEFSDVVISSRVRLARNLNTYPFSPKLDAVSAKKMNEEILSKLSGLSDETGCYLASSISQMEEGGRMALLERYMISSAMAEKKQETSLILAPDESSGIMVNEEDHIRIQAVVGAMNIKKAWDVANRLDNVAGERLPIAYHDKFGYLTACPTNVGTGLRASYMVFLPALDAQGRLSQLISEAGSLGVAIRGMYGEGTKANASIYQISNQKTLGSTEEEIMEKLDTVVFHIIQLERKRREYIISSNYSTLEDQIYRSYGVLKYTRQINTKDSMTLLSQLKFGVETGIIKLKQGASLFRLMIEIQPANLSLVFGKSQKSAQRDRQRAEYLNKNLPEISEEKK